MQLMGHLKGPQIWGGVNGGGALLEMHFSRGGGWKEAIAAVVPALLLAMPLGVDLDLGSVDPEA